MELIHGGLEIMAFQPLARTLHSAPSVLPRQSVVGFGVLEPLALIGSRPSHVMNKIVTTHMDHRQQPRTLVRKKGEIGAMIAGSIRLWYRFAT
ncbi:MAG TPA: hypothetical protein VM639_04530 [Dongiaceae bacterium]|nr:hypothetical protein [Dongiaceae bacterium]